MPIVIDPVYANIFRSDAFYANPDCTKYSIVKIDDTYKKFSECIASKYPGYILNDKNLIVNKDDVEMDIDELKEYFLSKDLENYEIHKDKYFGKQTRFLKEKQKLSISYASFPRSGNTFLRKYFESITGLATGSDMVMKFSLNVGL